MTPAVSSWEPHQPYLKETGCLNYAPTIVFHKNSLKERTAGRSIIPTKDFCCLFLFITISDIHPSVYTRFRPTHRPAGCDNISMYILHSAALIRFSLIRFSLSSFLSSFLLPDRNPRLNVSVLPRRCRVTRMSGLTFQRNIVPSWMK